MSNILGLIVGLAVLFCMVLNLLILGLVVLIWFEAKNQFKEIVKVMNAQEQALNAGLDVLNEGINAIVAELQQLRTNNPDLADEIARVEGMGNAIREAIGTVQGGGTPDPIEVPPATGGGTAGTGSETPGTDAGTGSSPTGSGDGTTAPVDGGDGGEVASGGGDVSGTGTDAQ